ncbi:MAG: zinc ribbon domain-containing protein [Bacteroidales bacterium]|nr:zinc ribbon domain-containing protein [Bacteroidales bacterium]
MKVKCDYCGAAIDETMKHCPNCGAALAGANRASDEQPKTIEELQAWYVAHHLPPENITRFFIGKDIREPKAFGIYKNEVGDCVVYKNKSTGERAIRYQGADEAYAVNELYQRLKAEIVDQKSRQPGKSTQPTSTKKTKKWGCIIPAIFMFIIALCAIFDKSVPSGYYNYQGTQYYHQGSEWYYYDADRDDWYQSSDLEGIDDKNYKDYRIDTHTGKDFETTSWYDAGNTNDDYDWDDDDDWDYDDDDWDSGSTDWDSDW